jgi:hypothetical protein
MSFIVKPSLIGAGKIGYKNLFTELGATVTASTEETDYDKENAYDGFGYDWWKPTVAGDSWLRVSLVAAQTADYMAIWGHDLSLHGSSIKTQYSIDNGSTWVDATYVVTPTNDNTIFINFTTILAADWRVLVTNPTTIAAIAGVQIGEALTFPRAMENGFAPPSLAPMIKLKTSRTESGAFLGGSKLSEGIKGSFNLTNLNPAWVRSVWQPFINYAQTPKTFVFSWDSVNHSNEVILGWVTDKVPDPKYITPLLMSISLNFEGTL